MATFDDVRRLGARLPEVEEGTSYGTPALKVGGKAFCRVWRSAECGGLASMNATACMTPRSWSVFCDLDEKELLLDNAGGVLFSTPHYAGSPALLVRLADVDVDLPDRGAALS